MALGTLQLRLCIKALYLFEMMAALGAAIFIKGQGKRNLRRVSSSSFYRDRVPGAMAPPFCKKARHRNSRYFAETDTDAALFSHASDILPLSIVQTRFSTIAAGLLIFIFVRPRSCEPS